MKLRGSDLSSPPGSYLLAAAIAVLTCGGIAVTWHVAGPETRSSNVGAHRNVRDVTIYRVTGAPVGLDGLLSRERLLVLAVFAPECHACIAEAHVWQQWSEDYGDAIRIAAAAMTTDTTLIAGVRQEARLAFPIYLIDRLAAERLGVGSLPAIVVVDGLGDVVFDAAGRLSTVTVGTWLEDLRSQ